jgi:hypothetical protein
MKSVKLLAVVAVGWFGGIAHVAARDIYVDNVAGLETNDGLAGRQDGERRGPFQTIHRGMRTAVPGDVVHLVKNDSVPYRESVVFHDRMCPADKPIVLDGHGAVIEGCEAVDLAQWELVEPGLYRKVKLLAHCDSAVVGRFFFRFDGAMQHMGRTSKGPSAKLKEPMLLKPGEWTFVPAELKVEARELVDAKDVARVKEQAHAEGAFYLKIDPAKKVSDYRIEYPARSSGVQVSGRNENIVIRNLEVRHVYNDGYNIHGYSRGVLFENVAAIECGDDGISAHDDCRITVRGLRSIGNSTGFCHTNESWSDSENVTIQDCLGFDVFVLGSGRHRLAKSRVSSAASSSVVTMGPSKKEEAGECLLEMDDVTVVRAGRNQQMRLMARSVVRVTNCTIAGFHIACAAAELTVRDSKIGSVGVRGGEVDGAVRDDSERGDAVADRPKTLSLDGATKFTGANNVYDLKEIVRGAVVVNRENWATEAAKLGDAGSTWGDLSVPRDNTSTGRK